MIDNSYPDVKQLQDGMHLRRNVLVWIMLAVVLVVVGTMTAIEYFLPQVDPPKIILGGFVILICLTLPVVICYSPRIGLYILFAGALLFPGGRIAALATMPTSWVPFWWNLSTTGWYVLNTTSMTAAVFSPAEVIMVLTFTIWLVRMVVMRELQWRLGRFFWPIGAYTLMVAVGFATGMMKGGNVTMALYEVRAQAYFIMVYVMAVNMFTDRRQLMGLIWTAVICNGIQGITGAITYFVQKGNITEEGFMAHEESLLLNLIFFIAMFAVMLRLDKRLIWASLLLAPAALTAILGNQRRASIAAFLVAFIPVLPIMWVILKGQRRNLGIFIGLFAVCAAIYLPLAWNSNGAWALPARAIRSQSDPNGRDQASDWYRSDEEFDLKVTRDTSPVFGVGYGSPFLQPRPLPKVSTDFVYYMPHNSILWVWMRLGHVGFFLFWIMVATFLIRGLEAIRQAKSPEVQMGGLLAIMMLLMTLTFGKYDLALIDSRILTIEAVLLGILGILPELDRHKENQHGAMDDEEDGEGIHRTLPSSRVSGSIPF